MSAKSFADKLVRDQNEIEPGDQVRFYPVAGRRIFEDHLVEEVWPNGIPSCREPMLKLKGKAGAVLVAHCKLMRPTPAQPDAEDGKGET